MRPPDEVAAGIERELDLAERSIAAGSISDARSHISEAERLKASQPNLARLHMLADRKQSEIARNSRGGVWIAFGSAVFAYLIISIQSPLRWGVATWIALAFIAAPLLTALILGGMLNPEMNARSRFFAGFWPTAAAMFLYSMTWLAITRSRISTGGDAGQLLLIGVMVPAIYAVAAGSVSGAVCAASVMLRRRTG